MTRLLLLLGALALSGPVGAQETSPSADSTLVDPTGHFAVFTADGTPADPGSSPGQALDAVVAAMAEADVVFLGEAHNDPVTHALQRRLLEAAHRTYGDTRSVLLSLEMFERDAQLVLDEYLAGLIREQDFLAAARPWRNYAADYRPLVEYAKAHGLPVVAANAPGRYVSRVGREGMAGLDALDPAALAYLPPSPVAPASDSLAAKFTAQMGDMSRHPGSQTAAMPSLEHMIAAQNLRDATMGFSIAERLTRNPGALVIHVNGAFHSEGGLGTVEQLEHYAPGTRALVVTFQPVADVHAAPTLTGDAFVVQTNEALQSGE